MNRIIGDRTGKSALDEMEEIAKQRNADVAEEERLEKLEAARRLREEAERAEAPPVIASASGIGDIKEDYICLNNIVLKDADGDVKEQYTKLYVKKDIERNADKAFISFTPYKGISHFEQQGDGLFLPSFGLSCRIAVELFNARMNCEIKNALNQYWDYVSGDGKGYGRHCQNTLIDWHRNHIINYPYDGDFNTDGGNNVNVDKMYRLSFERAGLKTMNLEDVFSGNNTSMKRFAKQFTMLEHPEALIELGKYFQKPAMLWMPDVNCKYTGATWLGCDDSDFVLNASNSLYVSSAARGVRLS